MSLFASLTPLLLGLLAFTAFVEKIRRDDGGRHSFTTAGYIFLALGFAGLIGSFYVSISNYYEGEKSKKDFQSLFGKVGELAKLNSDLQSANKNLELSQQDILKNNMELVELSIKLNSQIADQQEKIKELLSANSILIAETKQRGKQLEGLRNQAEMTTHYEKIQAQNSKEVAELNRKEEERRRDCMQRVKSVGSHDKSLLSANCADFYRPRTGPCRGYDGPGGPCYDGPGGALYSGPGGRCYDGPGGPCYSGPGGTGERCPPECP